MVRWAAKTTRLGTVIGPSRSGVKSSWNWLCELMPGVFVEMSPELASEKGIKGGDRVLVKTARGSLGGAAIVTHRLTPYKLNGKTVHQIGVPWHWGYEGRSCGCSANTLTPNVGDANTMIPEYKAFLVRVKKGGA